MITLLQLYNWITSLTMILIMTTRLLLGHWILSITMILIMTTRLLLCHWNTSLTMILIMTTLLVLGHWIMSVTMILITTTLLLLGHWITSSTHADSCHWSRTQPANLWSRTNLFSSFLFLFSQQQERISIIALENFHRPVHRLKSVDCSLDYFLWIALVSIVVRTITYLWNSLSVAGSWDYTYLFPWNQWTTDCFDFDREYLEYIGSITLFPCSVTNSRSTHLLI